MKHRIYTAEEITEMCDTWANYNGHTGEICGNLECHRTANVFALGSGWICDCGHYNVQSFYQVNIPHENPDMGTPNSVLIEGHKNSVKWKKLLGES
jgi:hypothetical protein